MKAHTLQRSVVLPATPDQVWAVIGDFAGLAEWNPQLPQSVMEDGADPEVPGAVRVFAIDGKVVARERLLRRDAEAHWYRYLLLDPLFLPMTDYVATLAARPHEDGTEVRWTAEYQAADEVVPQVESIVGDDTYGAGLDALRERFGRS